MQGAGHCESQLVVGFLVFSVFCFCALHQVIGESFLRDRRVADRLGRGTGNRFVRDDLLKTIRFPVGIFYPFWDCSGDCSKKEQISHPI